MSDRNVKFLLLVDGYEMNQIDHAGAVTELENWDLNDIARIEVIRGPGSVTYGPGAIAGVINIVTKSASDAAGLRIGTAGNLTYNSLGGYASYGKQTQSGLDIYTYGSIVRTLGYSNPKVFEATDSISGYAGSPWESVALAHNDPRAANPASYGGTPAPYFGDYKDWPQGKFGLDARYSEFRFLGRFTNSGNTAYVTVSPATVPDGDGGRVPGNQNQMRQYLLAGEDNHVFNGLWTQQTKLSWNDQDYSRWNVADTTNLEELRNYMINFSEKHLTLQSMAQLKFSEDYKVALGASYARNITGAPWGESSDQIRMGDGNNFFGGSAATVLSTDSNANLRHGIYTGNGSAPSGSVKASSVIWVGDGWSTNSYAMLGEANLAFSPYATVLLSGRADKDDNTNWGLSPRVALVSEINSQNIVKLIAQRSVRQPNAEISYQQAQAGTISDPEIITDYEAIYNWLPLPELSFQTSGFYYDYNVQGFNRSTNLTQDLGDLQMAGLEFEAKYSTPKFTIGFNHSFDKQLSWDLSSDPTVSGGVSYADIRYRFALPTFKVTTAVLNNGSPVLNSKGQDSTVTTTIKDTAAIHSVGNDILNWSNQASKIYMNWTVIPAVTLHVDGQIFYGEQGEKDMLTALTNMANSLPARDSVTQRELLATIANAQAQNPYDMQLRFNAAASWHFLPWASVTAYCQNLFSVDPYRYAYDAVNNGIWPARASWVVEPRTFGLKLDATIPGL
jgi:outer membrane receptor protein involved in Fe transport